jgi:segregation and condensation protein A
MSSYTVKTQVFEGPFDLLLSLIEERKLSVSDVSLSSVTDDFIKHVNERKGIDIGETAHFVLVASTLLLIKSKNLLPVLSFSDDEQGDIRDLEKRLRLYERFRSYAQHIRDTFGTRVLFARSETKLFYEPIFSPSSDVTVAALADASRRVLASLPKHEALPEKEVRKVISLEDMISHLAERVTGALQLSFKDFAQVGKTEKVHVIVSFLAMLELVKQGILSVIQSEHYSDIDMKSEQISRPRY